MTLLEYTHFLFVDFALLISISTIFSIFFQVIQQCHCPIYLYPDDLCHSHPIVGVEFSDEIGLLELSQAGRIALQRYPIVLPSQLGHSQGNYLNLANTQNSLYMSSNGKSASYYRSNS